jgi:tyrosine-protein kinase Etk/Wzc
MNNTVETDASLAFVRKFLQNVYSLKYVYIACVIIFAGIAFFYNKYSAKVYEISSVIGPTRDNSSSILLSNASRGYSSYTSGKNVGDAINALSSFSLILSSVNDLNLEIGYFAETKRFIKQTSEVYLQSPFIVKIDKSHIQPLGVKYHFIFLSDSTFRLIASTQNASLYNFIDNRIVAEKYPVSVDTICNFNRTIDNQNFKFLVSPNRDYYTATLNRDNSYYFEFYNPEVLAKYYLDVLKIEPVSVQASILKLKFIGNNLDKALDFLNNYTNIFLEDNLAKKNKIAVKTINFIDSQISEISDSLVISESKLRNYKSANQVMDLSFQGQRIYEQMSQIEKEKTNLELQSRYYNYVLNYLKTNKDMSGVTPPSSSNISDPGLNQLITDLTALYTERSTISAGNSEKNLFLSQIDNKIKIQKQVIIETVTNNLNTLNLTLNELNYKAEKTSKEISNLPRTEMNMVNIQRKYNLNDAIFISMLQKRSDAEISRASNYPDYEIIEPARAITSKIVRPSTMINYFLSVFFALLFPTGFIVVRDFFNDKVSGTFDIEHLLGRNVLGTIYSNQKKYESVVVNSPNTAISESFRSLRGNLLTKLKSQKSKVILISSSQPQDGKSFISFNLSISFASSGYKTIIIDGDLRRPVIHTKFGMENLKGVSNFMTKDVALNDLVHKTSFENLYFIPAGPILPNPSELIDAGVLDELFDYLKSNFEYIIIDTSPVGLVADAVQLMRYASRVLIVSRNNVTKKTILSNSLDILKANNIPNYDVILNDLKFERSAYSRYTAYYVKE